MDTTGNSMRTLTPALAASTVAHLALLLALIAVVQTMPATMRNAAPTLSVVLAQPDLPEPFVAEPVARVPVVAAPAQPTPKSAVVVAPAPTAAVPPPLAVTPAAVDTMSPPTAGGTAQARVEYATAGGLARLGEAFRTRSLLEFPPEIDMPVRLADTIDVLYPEAALDERREATVVAWVVVEASGQVEEIAIIEGDPEFGEPVQEALLKAKFHPARDKGQPIRFHTMLEFRFRLDDATPLTAAQPR